MAMGMSNVSYDLLSVLQNKLEGMEAYDKYIQDAQQAGDQQCQQLLSQIKQQDGQQVEQLRNAVEQLVKEGKFH